MVPGLTAFVGLNQWLYVVAGVCPASIVLEHFIGLRSALHAEEELRT